MYDEVKIKFISNAGFVPKKFYLVIIDHLERRKI